MPYRLFDLQWNAVLRLHKLQIFQEIVCSRHHFANGELCLFLCILPNKSEEYISEYIG